MVIVTSKYSVYLRNFRHHVIYFSSASPKSLQECIKTAVKTKTYNQIPELLNSSKESYQNPNPFTFLSTFPEDLRTQTIDEILQNFIDIRPRYLAQSAYSCLLSYTLQNPNPLPMAFAILQRTLRSGWVPVPQTHLLLSNAWHEIRQKPRTVSAILLDMQLIVYRADSGICNYLISSLCKVDQLTEAVKVLKGMCGTGCIPDLDSYDYIIGYMCKYRRIAGVIELVHDMVGRLGLTPRHQTVVKVLGLFRSKKDMRRGVEMLEFLSSNGVNVGFESFNLVVKGCLECGDFVLAGKVAVEMTNRGFIPYIEERQKIFDKLVGVGELELANVLRRRFMELNS
jgi:pentatricopeptide repeat protein